MRIHIICLFSYVHHIVSKSFLGNDYTFLSIKDEIPTSIIATFTELESSRITHSIRNTQFRPNHYRKPTQKYLFDYMNSSYVFTRFICPFKFKFGVVVYSYSVRHVSHSRVIWVHVML